jgi:hypothetical protein
MEQNAPHIASLTFGQLTNIVQNMSEKGLLDSFS